ncbi:MULTISPECIES: nuclear transport factor 2 family protein [Luteimonas]|uniref:nuclear transport factor 2 family protein n=1 Tax=Luteimonas TaxID=83614 RepID=UPI001E534980|nr:MULTISPECIES: nuclear transport factor 2 family protein [Luteimonas]
MCHEIPHVRRMAATVFALLVLAFAAGCARAPPEEALRAQVAALQQSLEARDASALEALLDEDFIGPDGMDRRAARRMATLMLMRQQAIGVTAGPLDVQLQGEDSATVRTTAALTGGSGRLLPDNARAYRVDSTWRRRGDTWRMLSIRWEPAL